jgi:hypothetical protein
MDDFKKNLLKFLIFSSISVLPFLHTQLSAESIEVHSDTRRGWHGGGWNAHSREWYGGDWRSGHRWHRDAWYRGGYPYSTDGVRVYDTPNLGFDAYAYYYYNYYPSYYYQGYYYTDPTSADSTTYDNYNPNPNYYYK